MATAPVNPASEDELDADDIARSRFRKALARKKRKEREAEGEIKELNITAMMDIMTIILVFLIKSYTASSVTMTASEDIRPPLSTTRLTPKDTVAVTVTPRHILVGDKVKATLEKNMQPRKEEMQGKLILPLDAALKKEVEKLKYIAERNPSAPFMHEVSIIGDRRIPYEVLSSVLYTAGQNELENFRFVVISKADD
jgi:biopolymer transport protein ExbD